MVVSKLTATCVPVLNAGLAKGSAPKRPTHTHASPIHSMTKHAVKIAKLLWVLQRSATITRTKLMSLLRINLGKLCLFPLRFIYSRGTSQSTCFWFIQIFILNCHRTSIQIVVGFNELSLPVMSPEFTAIWVKPLSHLWTCQSVCQ